ncbi:unnamed protein product [Malus baccata var. baccata]
MVWAFLTFPPFRRTGCLSLAKKKRRNHGKMPIDKSWMQSGRSSEDYFNGVEVQQHLLYNGIIKNYTRWYFHGEDENHETDEGNSDSDSDGDDDMHGLVEEGCPHDPNKDAEKFYKLLKEAEQPLYDGNRVVLFNCDWYDIVRKGTSYKIDRYGIISINTTSKLNTKEPFVLANQATQAFYPRNVYEMPNVDDDDEPYQEEEAHGGIHDDEDDEIVG